MYKPVTLCLLLTGIMFILSSEYSCSQQFDMDITVDSSSSDTYRVNVSLTNGDAPYTYYLYDETGWKDNKPLKEVALVYKNNHRFSGLVGKQYIIMVMDHKKKRLLKSVNLKN